MLCHIMRLAVVRRRRKKLLKRENEAWLMSDVSFIDSSRPSLLCVTMVVLGSTSQVISNILPIQYDHDMDITDVTTACIL